MTIMDAESPLFLDTNVLIYASIQEAPEHPAVRGFVEQHLSLGTPLYISRQVLREYLAVLSRPQSNFKNIPQASVLLWLKTWRDRCRVLDDTEIVMETLWQLYADIPFGGKQVHDANLIATLFSYGLDTLVTVNTADFVRFMPRLKLLFGLGFAFLLSYVA
ncbi:MAG: PIN domain-containing protein, partial [Anaerolineae bacterium]|nr:PIN domain-containing protein [Anaerolineae bacterium]